MRVVVLTAPAVTVGSDVELRLTNDGWCAKSKTAIDICGVPLEAGAERIVFAGDRIVIPNNEEVELAEPEGPADLATFQLALREVDRIVRERRSNVPCIIVAEGRDRGAHIELTEERAYVIGRGREFALSLADGDASREHCAVRRRGDVVEIWDLGSTTGTFMGRQRISDVHVVWEPSTMVRIGKTVLRVTKPAAPPEDAQVKQSPDPTTAPKSEPTALPVPAAQAPVAAVPALTPAPKRSRDFTKIIVWVGSGLLVIFSISALIWIFR